MAIISYGLVAVKVKAPENFKKIKKIADNYKGKPDELVKAIERSKTERDSLVLELNARQIQRVSADVLKLQKLDKEIQMLEQALKDPQFKNKKTKN